jgi:hypothetical protein
MSAGYHPSSASERPCVKKRQEEDNIETRDSTCRLQRQVGKPKYIIDAYTSPKYQATEYEAEMTNSTVFQPRCPSEDVYETHNLKHINTNSQMLLPRHELGQFQNLPQSTRRTS